MDFRTFEHSSWERIADAYDRHIAPVTEQAIKPLLDALRIGPEVRLLDIAMGPGHLASKTARRGASVTGIDFSERMVLLAHSTHGGAFTPLIGDAEHLPFAHQSFDTLAMNFGVLHLAYPERALAEAHRVLKPGGRFGFTSWTQPEADQGLGILNSAIQEYGNTMVDVPEGPNFFRFGDSAECEKCLLKVGFRRVFTWPLQLEWVLLSSDDFFTALLEATVRGGGVLQKQPETTLRRIRAAIDRACEQYRSGAELRIPMPALLVLSEK